MKMTMNEGYSLLGREQVTVDQLIRRGIVIIVVDKHK